MLLLSGFKGAVKHAANPNVSVGSGSRRLKIYSTVEHDFE
jgi:hypothetical protein